MLHFLMYNRIADPLYGPVTLEPAAQPNGGSKSPVVEYDKLVHLPTPQVIHINCKYCV